MGLRCRMAFGHTIFALVIYRGMLYDDTYVNIYIHCKSNDNVVYSCKYHGIWCPKSRRPVLVNGVDALLKEIIRDVSYRISMPTSWNWRLCPIIFPSSWKSIRQDDFDRLIRTDQLPFVRLLRQEYACLRVTTSYPWTNSSCVSLVGGAFLDVITPSIENQKRV